MITISIILCSDMHMDIEKANLLISCIDQNKEYNLVTDYTGADGVIIMTCAFGEKKHYSMWVIADVLRNVKPGCRVIATGCLTKINGNELKAIPNLEVKSFEEVPLMFTDNEPKVQGKIRQNTVIISDGCLKKCSYCVYPMLVKKYKSKPIEDILQQIEELQKYESTIYLSGAQETSDYGIDLYGIRKFHELLKTACINFPNCKFVIGWFHPSGLTDEVINTLAELKNVVGIMVHVQHNDNEILKDMNRPKFEFSEERLQRLHSVRPDIEISTEIIVGFPGETEEKFCSLVTYLENSIFSDIGVASYEPVLNTNAGQLPNLPEYSVRNKRMGIIKEKFDATTYHAPKEDFKSILSTYFEACFMLPKIPKICVNSEARQQYQYIAGTDTQFKKELLADITGFIAQMIKEISECDETLCRNQEREYYTTEFKKWIYDILKQYC